MKLFLWVLVQWTSKMCPFHTFEWLIHEWIEQMGGGGGEAGRGALYIDE